MKLKSILAASAMLVAAVAAKAQMPELRFSPSGKFKIMQVTDTHYKWGKGASDAVVRLLEEALDDERPDLVVITGDMVYADSVAQAMQAVMQPIIARGVPWAFTFGNHDTQFELDHAQIYDLLQGMPGSMMPARPLAEESPDYTIEILSSRDGKDVASVLYCLDSHVGAQVEGAGRYAWMDIDQVKWYADLSRAYTRRNGGNPIPSLMFFHIPLPEVSQAYDDRNNMAFGNKKEKVCCPAMNSGMFTTALQLGDITGMFFGHDHDNDFIVDSQGILLGYGRYSGGKTVYNHLGNNGVRIINLTEGQRDIDTYVRLLGGEIIDRASHPADFKGKRKKK